MFHVNHFMEKSWEHHARIAFVASIDDDLGFHVAFHWVSFGIHKIKTKGSAHDVVHELVVVGNESNAMEMEIFSKIFSVVFSEVDFKTSVREYSDHIRLLIYELIRVIHPAKSFRSAGLALAIPIAWLTRIALNADKNV